MTFFRLELLADLAPEYLVNPEKPTNYVPVVSITGAIVGGTMLLVSIPLYAVGTVKLNKAAELSFISPSGGMGLVLNF